MYRILLPIDDNEKRAEQAVDTVISLPGTADELAVTILNVHKDAGSIGDDHRVQSSEFYDEANFPESVGKAVELLEAAGIEVTKRRAFGEPAEQITDVADEMDADAIVMWGRKRTPAGKVLFGSVTQSVLISANRPVFIALSDQ